MEPRSTQSGARCAALNKYVKPVGRPADRRTDANRGGIWRLISPRGKGDDSARPPLAPPLRRAFAAARGGERFYARDFRAGPTGESGPRRPSAEKGVPARPTACRLPHLPSWIRIKRAFIRFLSTTAITALGLESGGHLQGALNLCRSIIPNIDMKTILRLHLSGFFACHLLRARNGSISSK